MDPPNFSPVFEPLKVYVTPKLLLTPFDSLATNPASNILIQSYTPWIRYQKVEREVRGDSGYQKTTLELPWKDQWLKVYLGFPCLGFPK